MAKIFAFLEVEPLVDTTRFEVELNREQGKKRDSEFFRRLASSPGVRNALDLVPASLRESLVRKARVATGTSVEKPKIDTEFRRQLEDFFRPEVEQLRQFTGENYSSWSI